jgi:hypothetical protein
MEFVFKFSRNLAHGLSYIALTATTRIQMYGDDQDLLWQRFRLWLLFTLVSRGLCSDRNRGNMSTEMFSRTVSMKEEVYFDFCFPFTILFSLRDASHMNYRL